MSSQRGQWVELRVHGVSGTPPEELLDRPHVRQVDGDDKSRFFRATRGDGTIDDSGDHVVEAYHWGRYTSGSWKQSFWLALLPFGMINLAAFMLPPTPREEASRTTAWWGRRARTLALGALRSVGLLMTMLLSAALSLTATEVVAVQWLGQQGWAPEALKAWGPALATVVSALAVAFLGGRSWFIAVSRRKPPDDESPLAATPVIGEVGAIGGTHSSTPLGRKNFYSGDADTVALRGLHLAAGVAVPAFLALSLRGSGLELWCALFLLAVTLLTAFMGDRDTTGLTHTTQGLVVRWHRLMEPLTVVIVVAAAGLVVLGARAAYDLPTERVFTRGSDAMTGYIKVPVAHTATYNRAFEVLLYASAVAVGVLVAAVVALAVLSRGRTGQADARPYFRRYTWGLAALPMATMALFLGVGYSAALVDAAITVLGTDQGQLAQTTSMLARVSSVFTLSLVPIVLFLAVLMVVRRTRRGALLAFAERDLPDDLPYPRTRLEEWQRHLAGAIWTARAKNLVPLLVWLLAGTGTVLAGAVLVESWRDDPARSFLTDTSGPLVEIGTWVLVAMVGALISLARGAFRDAGLRRTVNIIWDVVAFWPHAVHPFIPTPYSLRTVIDLVARIRHHLAESPDGRAVVVCGHSQGSLISFAALHLLRDAELRRVGLLTFGSQLRVIFPKAFPAYVDVGSITDLHDRLDGAWVNLYRDTDPLAGPVLSWDHERQPGGSTARWFGHESTPGDAVPRGDVGTVQYGDDWRLVDPVPRAEPLQRAPINQIDGHSYFWTHPDWRPALDELRSRGAGASPAVPEGLPGELHPGGDRQHDRDDHHHHGGDPDDVTWEVPDTVEVVEGADQPA